MSRGSAMPVRAGGGLLRGLVTLAFLLAVGTFVINSPSEAGSMVSAAWDWFMNAVHALTTFLKTIFGG